MDFYEYGEVDPMLFIEYSRSYDQFERAIDPDYKIIFSVEQQAILEYVSSFLVNG